MESFLMACSVVGPLVVYMAVGRIILQTGMFPGDHFRTFNQLLFRLFIPLSLFFSIYETDLQEVLQPKLFLYVEICLVLSCVCAWFALRRFVKNKPDLATITQGIFRSNYVLYGGMMAASLCDEKGVALAAALTATVVPTVNIGGVVLFELARGGKVKPAELLCRILKNPLVEAGIAGILLNIFTRKTGIWLPSMILKPLKNLANAATPLALVTLGGMLSFGSLKSHVRELITAVSGKLIIVPVLALGIGMLLGYRQNELIVLLAVFGSPTAVASAPMAQVMGGNGDLAAEIVATSTVLSVVTIFVFVYLLSFTGMI